MKEHRKFMTELSGRTTLYFELRAVWGYFSFSLFGAKTSQGGTAEENQTHFPTCGEHDPCSATARACLLVSPTWSPMIHPA
jgi:hypothetical protein